MSSFPGLSRSSGTKSVAPQYFMIYEGEVTEKDYFDGIRRATENSKLKLKVSLKEIKRYETEWFGTDLNLLITLADSFIKSIDKKRYHSDYFANMILEPYCKEKRKDIKNKNEYSQYPKFLSEVIAPFKNNLIENLKINGIIDEEGFVTDSQKAINYCISEIKSKFDYDIQGKIRTDDIEHYDVRTGDQVCIVHDRDYSKKYFDNNSYLDAVHSADCLSKSGVNYRLIITYPKFEFWLVMHLMKMNHVQTLNFDYLKNYSGNVCPRRDEQHKTGPSKYVSELFYDYFDIEETKHIGDIFDERLLPNIENAINISKNKSFVTDVKDLMDNPGTNMGLLIEEILNTQPQ